MIDNNKSESNRRNAARSTGPRTGDGKARSSQNARRNGWFARTLRVAADKVQLFADFENAWLEELEPAGLLESEAFSDFLRAAWHKREIIEAQNNLDAPNGFLDRAAASDLDRLHRYERDFERRAARALRELRRLQTERVLRAQLRPDERLGKPPLAAAAALAKKRSQTPENLVQDLYDALCGQAEQRPAPAPPQQQPAPPAPPDDSITGSF